MRRISAAELERLKTDIDLVALVEAKGVKLKWHGANMVGHCPFHDDRKPSFIVTPKKNLWHCMGECSIGGSVIDWVMKVQGVSFRHAVEILRSGKAASLLAAKPAHTHREPIMPSPVDAKANDQTLMRQVVDYYHQTLLSTEEARNYLASRGLNDETAIKKFRLGYANRTLGLRLPSMQKAEGEKIRTRLFELGVYRETGHEHLSGRLVMPVLATNGAVTEIYGRMVVNPAPVPHLYLPGPHEGIWNPECLKSKDVILCEALIDALSFWVNGFKNVTSSYGTNGFTPDHLRAFTEYGVRRVFIAYDNDDPGNIAADPLAKQLTSEGMECWRVQFPKGMDANDVVRTSKTADKMLKVCLETSELMGNLSKSKSPKRPSSLAADPKALAAAPEAVRSAEAPAESARRKIVAKNPTDLAEHDTDEEILGKVARYYHEGFAESVAAKEYLEKRGIYNVEAIAKFQIGFADVGRTLSLPPSYRADGVAVRERLTKLGLTRGSSPAGTFLGSVVIPVIDANGTVRQIYGRKVTVTSALREGTPEHTFLAGPHRGIWNPECATSKDVILCGSLIDALTFWVNGFKSVTASYGPDGFTVDHMKAFVSNGVRRIFIAYGRSAACDKAAAKLAVELANNGIEAWRVNFPAEMGANEYALEHEPAAQTLKVCLETAELSTSSNRPTLSKSHGLS